MIATTAPLTDLIRRAREGDADAGKEIFDAAYGDLRKLASSRLASSGRFTLLNTTALVHESWLRFSNAGSLAIADRQHFMRYASHVMRSVIVDLVRANRAARRGGDAVHVALDTGIHDGIAEGEDEIMRVHEALEELGAIDPRIVEVVEMRYFAGMTEPEIAAALGVTDRTVRRDWEKARLLLSEVLR